MGGLKNVYAIGAGKTNFYVLFLAVNIIAQLASTP
jgi:hypothetical protein